MLTHFCLLQSEILNVYFSRFNFKQNYIIRMRRIQIWDTGECAIIYRIYFLPAETFIT